MRVDILLLADMCVPALVCVSMHTKCQSSRYQKPCCCVIKHRTLPYTECVSHTCEPQRLPQPQLVCLAICSPAGGQQDRGPGTLPQQPGLRPAGCGQGSNCHHQQAWRISLSLSVCLSRRLADWRLATSALSDWHGSSHWQQPPAVAVAVAAVIRCAASELIVNYCMALLPIYAIVDLRVVYS